MSTRTISRIVGALFLAAFACYGIGNALVDRPFGPALMLLNSVAVATIGALMFGVLRHRHRRVAATYLMTRATEAILLSVGVILLTAVGSAEGNNLAYQLAMLTLGVGSVPFCRVLRRDRMVPGWLALWGVVGYVVLAAGALLALAGLNVGLVVAIPGGLFEVALGLMLIIRGLREPVATPPAVHRHAAPNRLGARA